MEILIGKQKFTGTKLLDLQISKAESLLEKIESQSDYLDIMESVLLELTNAPSEILDDADVVQLSALFAELTNTKFDGDTEFSIKIDGLVYTRPANVVITRKMQKQMNPFFKDGKGYLRAAAAAIFTAEDEDTEFEDRYKKLGEVPLKHVIDVVVANITVVAEQVKLIK